MVTTTKLEAAVTHTHINVVIVLTNERYNCCNKFAQTFIKQVCAKIILIKFLRIFI